MSETYTYKVRIDTLTSLDKNEVVDQRDFIVLWWPQGNDQFGLGYDTEESKPYFRVCKVSPDLSEELDTVTERLVVSDRGIPTLDVVLKSLAAVIGNGLV